MTHLIDIIFAVSVGGVIGSVAALTAMFGSALSDTKKHMKAIS